MLTDSIKWPKCPSIVLVGLAVATSAGTAYGAPQLGAGANKSENYSGLFREQLPGGTNTVRVSRSADDLYRFQMHGTYPSLSGGNFGDVDCKTKIANDLAIVKRKNWKNVGMWLLFKGDLVLVVQLGDSNDLELGNNVNLSGIYRRRTAGSGASLKPLPAAMNLQGVHFETQSGTLAFPGTFEEASPFHENLAIVKLHGKTGFIDLSGKFAIACKYSGANDFYNGLAAVTVDGKKWGYIDKTGNFVIKPIYDRAEEFDGSRALVEVGNKTFWIEKNGTRSMDKSCDGHAIVFEGLVSFAEKDLWGIVDKKGTVIVPAKYQAPLKFKEGLAPFKDERGKQGYLNTEGKEVISATYDQADEFSEDLASVQTRTSYGGESSGFGFVDKNGTKVIAEQFGEVFGAFNHGKCIVRRVGSPYISVIDKTGKQLLQFPLQIRDVQTSGIAESKIICHSVDFKWNSNGHDIPLDQDYKPLPAFANRDVKDWAETGLFVVSGPASLAKSTK